MAEMKIYNTAPLPDGRLKKELEAFELLDSLNIPYERVEHEAAMTIEDCHEVDKVLQTALCKNLFLTNSAKTAYYLLLMPGDKAFKTKDVSKQIGSTRLSFGTAEKMEELLNLTPGSVTVMGLMYDKDLKVQLLIDEELLNCEYICFHPNINTGSVKAKTADILNIFLPYTKHSPQFVKLERYCAE